MKICDIFDDNSYSKNNSAESFVNNLCNDSDNYPIKAYITFEAEENEIYKPENLSEAIAKDDKDDIKKKLKGRTMRQYVVEGSTLYNKLNEIIRGNKFKWKKDENLTVNDYRELEMHKKDNISDSILSITGNLNNEIYYSDIIAYLFSQSPNILNNFLKINGFKDVNSGYYKVTREEKNTDILIKNYKEGKPENKFLIVIENKISANFNTNEKKSWDSFIKLDEKKAEDAEKKKIIDKIKDEDGKENQEGKSDGQLRKYYLLAKYIAEINNISIDSDVKFLIICPKIYVKYYEEKKNKFAYGEKYKVCSYESIYNAIDEANLKSELNISTILEIKKCLEPHTVDINNLYISQNRYRFYKKIVAKKNIKNSLLYQIINLIKQLIIVRSTIDKEKSI